MKRIIPFMLCAMLAAIPAKAQTFARGADVSWCSEMEAADKHFYNAQGTETELMQLMREIGMNAIRLRVWVDPASFGYGAWSDMADVLAKARRVKAAGLDLMIDFHYSDFFADPGRQTIPQAWTNYTLDELKQAVAQHTREVLQTLKDEGIEPRWVQVGNETTNGMLWDKGKLWTGATDKGWGNYVALSNAGYDAVKAVLPNAVVIVHHDKGANDPTWFYTDFKKSGGKFDAIGLSHYPESNWQTENAQLATAITNMVNTHHVPVLVVETGYNATDENVASQVMTDLFSKLRSINGCQGIFYWEPQLYSWWRPAYYTKLGWNAYNKGAFTQQGRPSKALDAFFDPSDGIHDACCQDGCRSMGDNVYDLSGRKMDSNGHPRGIYIRNGHSFVNR